MVAICRTAVGLVLGAWRLTTHTVYNLIEPAGSEHADWVHVTHRSKGEGGAAKVVNVIRQAIWCLVQYFCVSLGARYA